MIDTGKFLRERFREPGRVVVFLKSYGAERVPDVEAVRKWFSRGSLTGEWLGTLLAYLELEHGEPVSLAPYLKGGNCGE